MSPRPLGRFIPYLALLAAYCLAAEASAIIALPPESGANVGGSVGNSREWLNRSEIVRQFPITTQKAAFVNLLKTKNVDVTEPVPDSLDNELPDMIEHLVNGVIDTFLSDVPFVGPILNKIVSGGTNFLKSIFGGGKVYIPDMPPLINCPDNIRKIQDKGRLSAEVSWVEPVGYDIEDGTLSVLRRGKGPGSRFSGETNIQYDTQDKAGGSDFCSFYITIEIVKCPLIPLQTKRINTCQGLSYYGDTCDFSCTTGYTLQGQKHLECTRDGVFDWPAPTCKINECAAPPLPVGGKSWICSNSYKYNSVCTIECADGYRNIRSYDRTPWDQAQITCKADGNWTRLPECKDVTAPVITNCPNYTKVYADRAERTALVVWPTIQAHDASGQNSVTVTQIRGQPKGSLFVQGAHEIAYEAVDDAGLKDTCTFYINVDVLHCDVPQKSGDKMVIDCPTQFMYGAACTVTCLHQIELEGSNRITCERIDDKMQWHYPQGPPKCIEKKCPKLPRVPNAEFQCNPLGGSTICSLACENGFIPPRNAGQPSTTCILSSGTWTKTDFAGCVRERDPTGIEKKIMIYWRSDCNAAAADTSMPDVVAIMEPILKKAMFFQGCTDCRVTDITATCGYFRSSKVVYLSWAIQHDLTLQEPIIQGKLLGVSGAQQAWLQGNLNATNGIHWKAGSPRSIKFRDRGDQPLCDDTLSPSPGALVCAACSPGTIALADGCQACPADTYQDDSGDATACMPCPAGTTTIGTGKGDAKDCKSPCPAGTDSPTGLTPCRDCSIGEYNDLTGQTACKKCPQGQYTPAPGSLTAADCYTPASEVVRFRVNNYGSDYVRLTWFRPDVLYGQHRGYVLQYRKRSESSVMKIIIDDITSETYEIDNLTPMTDYIFTMAAMNEHGPGVPASVEVTTEEQVTTTTTAAPTTTEDLNCPAGTGSYTGLKTAPGGCHECDIGFYQPLTGQTGCFVCKAGFTTWYTGTSLESDCVDETWTTPTTTTTTTDPATTANPGTPCPANHASSTGFEPGCVHCGDNKMPNPERMACIWCPFVANVGFQCP